MNFKDRYRVELNNAAWESDETRYLRTFPCRIAIDPPNGNKAHQWAKRSLRGGIHYQDGYLYFKNKKDAPLCRLRFGGVIEWAEIDY